MSEDVHRDLLERATVALERQQAAFERHERGLDETMSRWERSDAMAEQRHQALLERQERSELIFIEAMSDIDSSIQRNTERLDELGDRLADMGEAIRANTRAVLSVLDRFEPGTA